MKKYIKDREKKPGFRTTDPVTFEVLSLSLAESQNSCLPKTSSPAYSEAMTPSPLFLYLGLDESQLW